MYQRSLFLFFLCLLCISVHAIEAPDVLYTLPYPEGEEYLVSNAYNDWLTHVGKYAIDWKMEVGTRLLAARDGVVVNVIDRFTGWGTTPDYYDKANLITLRHDDGTFTDYVHLRKGGIKVRVGQRVKAGEFIGLSGDTGFGAVPHLHFMAYRMVNGKQESFPVKFYSGMAKPYEIFRHCRYLAPGPNCRPTVDPFEQAFPGELAKIKFQLAELAKAQPTPKQGAIAVRDHLKQHGDSYRKKYKEIYDKAQDGDMDALKLLEGFSNSMDLRTDMNIDRLFSDPDAAPIAEEAIELWNQIQVIE